MIIAQNGYVIAVPTDPPGKKVFPFEKNCKKMTESSKKKKNIS